MKGTSPTRNSEGQDFVDIIMDSINSETPKGAFHLECLPPKGMAYDGKRRNGEALGHGWICFLLNLDVLNEGWHWYDILFDPLAISSNIPLYLLHQTCFQSFPANFIENKLNVKVSSWITTFSSISPTYPNLHCVCTSPKQPPRAYSLHSRYLNQLGCTLYMTAYNHKSITNTRMLMILLLPIKIKEIHVKGTQPWSNSTDVNFQSTKIKQWILGPPRVEASFLQGTAPRPGPHLIFEVLGSHPGWQNRKFSTLRTRDHPVALVDGYGNQNDEQIFIDSICVYVFYIVSESHKCI